MQQRRKKLEAELDIWLQNQGASLDFSTYPDDMDIFGEIERTLVNETGWVSIGGVPDDIFADSWVCDFLNSECCTVGTTEADNYYWYDGRQRNMYLKIKLREWGVSSYCKGRVRSFKRNQSGTNTGGWKKDKVDMRIDLLGQHRDTECRLQGNTWSKGKPEESWKYKNRKKLYVTKWEWGSLMRAQDGDMNVSAIFKNRGNQQNALLIDF